MLTYRCEGRSVLQLVQCDIMDIYSSQTNDLTESHQNSYGMFRYKKGLFDPGRGHDITIYLFCVLHVQCFFFLSSFFKYFLFYFAFFSQVVSSPFSSIPVLSPLMISVILSTSVSTRIARVASQNQAPPVRGEWSWPSIDRACHTLMTYVKTFFAKKDL